MATETALYIERVLRGIRKRKDTAKDYIASGACATMEDYKYAVGQLDVLEDFENLLRVEYTQMQQELYGNEGDTDYVNQENTSQH